MRPDGKVPLRFRAPNPPKGFYGRDAELEALAVATVESAVVVVSGPVGIGKSSLVCAAVHGPLVNDLTRTAYASLNVVRSEQSLALELARALAEIDGTLEGLDWTALSADDEAAIETLLELAESREMRVIVDEIHFVSPDQVTRLIRALSRHARRSRWVLVDRESPADTERVSILEVPVLPDDLLTRIATEWVPQAPTSVIADAVHVSYGSPGRLRDALYGTDESSTRLPPEAMAACRAMSLVSAPIPREILATLAPMPPEPVFEDLCRRGLVAATAFGMRLHEVLRRELSAASSTTDERVALREALVRASRPDLLLEALRLALEDRAEDAAAAILAAHGSRLLADGYASALWGLLEHRREAVLDAWRAQAAAQLGNPTALFKVLSAEDGRARVVDARTLFAKGALRELSQRASPAAGADDRIWIARSLLQRGMPEAARTLLAAPMEGTITVAARALSVLCDATLDDLRDDPLRIARTIVPNDGVDGKEALAHLAEALRIAGRLDDAASLLESAYETGTALLVDRRLCLLCAAVAIDRGELAHAEAMLAKLAPSLRSASLLRPEIVAQTARLGLLRGERFGVRSALESALTEARSYDARTAVALVKSLLIELGGRRPGSAEPEGAPPGLEGDLFSLWTADADQRFGRAAELGTVGGFCRALRHVVEARGKLILGDPAAALESSSVAVDRASRMRHVSHQAMALSVRCAALLVMNRVDELLDDALTLRELAVTTENLPAGQEAELYVALAERPVDYATLERLAAQGDVSPTAAARASFLLGESPPLDRLDRAVVEGIDAPRLTTLEQRSEGPRWGVSRGDRRVWIPGEWHEFSRKPVGWRLLQSLVTGGGTATKEELVLGGWGETTYHPLKHDSRLQVAVRALREELEDEPAIPTRIITTENGYLLGGVVRVL